MTDFVGILDGSGKNWGIGIPDCPGAYGAGGTPDLVASGAITGRMFLGSKTHGTRSERGQSAGVAIDSLA